MSTCFILKEIGQINPWRKERVERMVAVLNHTGYTCRTLGKEICSETDIYNMDTQTSGKDALLYDFSNKLEALLKQESNRGDFIVATEAWQAACFKGLLKANNGKFAGLPVVELWIDYLNSFAVHRIFASRYTMYVTAVMQNQEGWQSNWITAKPYFTRIDPELEDVADSDEHTVSFVSKMISGIPTVAPDWGVWHEHIAHGVSGILYRTKEGQINAHKHAEMMNKNEVIAYAQERYSLQAAAGELIRFLMRLSDA